MLSSLNKNKSDNIGSIDRRKNRIAKKERRLILNFRANCSKIKMEK
jgi:hypothetical protein